MAKYRIRLVGGAEDEFGNLSARVDGGTCCVEFSYRGKMLNAQAFDFFEAFCRIRLELEQEHLLPFCYGASLNVHPSGMSRSMGGGLRAYRIKSRRHVDAADLMDIFSTGPDVVPASVARQSEFFEAWLQTPKIDAAVLSGDGAALARLVPPAWWQMPNSRHLFMWWLVVAGFYAIVLALNSRYWDAFLSLDNLVGGWWVVAVNAVFGAAFARRERLFWFAASGLSAMLILISMLFLADLLANLLQTRIPVSWPQ
jgi:hypothetical protein